MHLAACQHTRCMTCRTGKQKKPPLISGSICQRASGTTPQHSSPPDSGGSPLPAMKLHGKLRSRRQRILRGGRQSVTHSSHGSKAEYDSDSLHFLLFSFLVPCRRTPAAAFYSFYPGSQPQNHKFYFFIKKLKDISEKRCTRSRTQSAICFRIPNNMLVRA